MKIFTFLPSKEMNLQNKVCFEINGIDPQVVVGPQIFDSRNNAIVEHQGKTKYKKEELRDSEGFIFIDSDIYFGEGTIARLINLAKSKPKSVISGYYRIRNTHSKDTKMSFWKTKNVSFDSAISVQEISECENNVIKAYAISAGFMFIPSTVLEKLEYPYFMPTVEKNTESVSIMGEDVSFSKKCNKKKIPIYVDKALRLRHLGVDNVEAPLPGAYYAMKQRARK